MPRNVVSKLAFALRQALHDPALAQQLAKLATAVASDDLATPEGLSGFLRAEVEKWNQTLNAMHVAPE
jgi:tripartite-type tricarboxylate transporter receptor subunit TctC